MAELAAEAAGAGADQMLVCSTGIIGRLLPMDVIGPGIAKAGQELADGAAPLMRAARAILTTDTRIKVSTRRLSIQGAEVHVTGFAKGAAMIGPNMATMLAFVLTDAAVEPADLADIARRAAAQSFNCVSVEGHTSTNDSLILMANGEGPPLKGGGLGRFRRAAYAVCADLARAIAADAEGASHLVTIEVSGTRTTAEARAIAKAVADSALVKTALFGADPNWGRIVSAAGYAGVPFSESELSLWLGDTLLYQAGTPVPFDADAASAFMKQNRELTIRLELTRGKGHCTFWTCDLTYDYVRLNAEYTT
jgi:glutamate N-acetyltransferase/amino-acid N-acetyltransferase